MFGFSFFRTLVNAENSIKIILSLCWKTDEETAHATPEQTKNTIVVIENGPKAIDKTEQHKGAEKLLENVDNDEKNETQNASSSKQEKEEEILKVKKLFSQAKPPPSFEAFLGYVVIFGLILFYFFLADYRKVKFPNLKQQIHWR